MISLSKFHINKHGVPAPCKAKNQRCPYGDESQHFDTREQAQEYVDKMSSEEYGMLPEIKGDLPEKWRQTFLKYDNFDELVSEQAQNIVSDGVFEGSDNLYNKTLEAWKDTHYENSSKQLRELTNEESVKIIRDNVSPSHLHGWFREYNSDYKPKIEQSLITNPELRNASLNVAYINYKETTGENLSYSDFLEKEIEVYRGGNFNFIDNDVFVSYSFDRKIAEKFASQKQGSEVKSLKVRMKDTLGSLQTTGEAELMIRRKHTGL